MIFGHLYMKKHKVLLNMINNSITFFSKYYMYFRAFSSPILLKLEEIDIIPKVKQQDILPNYTLKKGSNENLEDLLKIS